MCLNSCFTSLLAVCHKYVQVYDTFGCFHIWLPSWFVKSVRKTLHEQSKFFLIATTKKISRRISNQNWLYISFILASVRCKSLFYPTWYQKQIWQDVTSSFYRVEIASLQLKKHLIAIYRTCYSSVRLEDSYGFTWDVNWKTTKIYRFFFPCYKYVVTDVKSKNNNLQYSSYS